MAKVIEQIQLRRGTAAEWMSANTILASGEPGFETDTLKHKIGDGVTAWADLGYAGGDSGVGLSPRATATVTTASLADNTSATGTIPLALGYRLVSIQTSAAARVRLYATAAHRTADAARDVDTDPTGDHGVILDYVTTPSVLSASLSPTVDGYSLESPPSINIPYSITNMSGAAAAITLTLVWQAQEISEETP